MLTRCDDTPAVVAVIMRRKGSAADGHDDEESDLKNRAIQQTRAVNEIA